MPEVDLVLIEEEAGPSSRRPAQSPGSRGKVRGGRQRQNGSPQFVVDLTNAAESDDEVEVVGVKRPAHGQLPHHRRANWHGAATMSHAANRAALLPPHLSSALSAPRPDVGRPALPQQVDQQPAPPPLPPSPQGMKCAICLEKITDHTSTPCGHVFCHQCLVDCIKAQKKCPKCRKGVQMKQIHRVYLDT